MPLVFRRYAVIALLALLAAFVPQARPARAANLSVTKTADSGAGSLRQAIIDANNSAGADTIAFNIPTSDPGYDATGQYWTIQPTSPLPALSGGGITIDGTTQPGGRTSGPKIVLDGAQAVDPNFGDRNSQGLIISSASNVIRGLVIDNFIRGLGAAEYTGGAGIQISGPSAANNSVVGCWIGLAPDGANALQNSDWGVLIDNGAHDNIIGGTNAADRNIISGNGIGNVAINELHSTNIGAIQNNRVIGNYIGTTPSGLAAIGGGNPRDGVVLGDRAQNNTIGGTTAGERNVISGHTYASAFILGSAINVNAQPSRLGSGNIISGNYIGLNKDGTAALANTVGVQLNGGTGTVVGGASASARNYISGNTKTGVLVQNSGTNNNTIANNWIGLDINGTPRGNGDEGVWVQLNATGAVVGPGNVISSNGREGVRLSTGGNTVKGNFISTNSTGTLSDNTFANGQVSVRLDAGTNNTIGGTTAADRNVIALSKTLIGIELRGTSGTHSVYGNYIGVKATGDAPFTTTPAAGSSGILIDLGSANNQIGSATAGAGNVIGGADAGIKLQDSGTNSNQIQNNSIGVGAGGQAAANRSYGIWLVSGPTNNTIGGTLGSAGNLVANSGVYGIYMDGSGASNNTIAGNTVRNNGVDGVRVRIATGVKITQTQTSANTTGSGIVLNSGGNNNLAAPANLQFSTPGGTPTLSGSACANCAVEVFTSPTRDDGEGPRYLTSATTDGAGSFSVSIAGCDRYLTATARDGSNNTSPFTTPMLDAVTGCQAAQADVQLDAASPAAQTVAPGATATYQHTLRNSGGASGTFTIAKSSTQAGWTITLNPTSVTLAAGATATINLSVTPPANAAGGAIDQTTITASVGAKSAQRTDTTTVQQVFAVDIAPNRSGQVTPPGTIDYTHIITNTGNGNDTFDLTETHTNSGVTVSFPDGASCALAPGASCSRRARITVGAAASGADTTTVKATSRGSASVFDQVQDTTTIASSAIPAISAATPNPQSIRPGQTATFVHTVTNIGNITGSFTVTLLNAAPAGWTFLYTTTASFSLAPNATRTVTVTITAKTGASAPNVGASATANVQVKSSDNALASTSDTATALLGPAFSFSPASQPTINNAQPGQTAVFTHTLTNDGNGTDTFTVTIAPPSGWTATPIAPITLARNASQAVIVRVRVPTGQAAGSYAFDVTAQTTSTPKPASITRTDTVVVVGSAVPKLSPGQTKTAPPPLPTTLTFTHALTNTGNQAGTFSLSAAVVGAPAGWSAVPSQPSCSLVQNASCTFTIQVTVPAGASTGDQAISLTASFAGPPAASDSVTDIVKVTAIPGLLFAPDRSANADPGTVLTYTHTLTNTGNGTDSFTITLDVDPGWSATVSPTIVANVPRGGARTVRVIVSVPGGLAADSTGTVTATAESALAPHPQANVIDRTTINAKPGATLIPDKLTLSANPTNTLSDTVTFQHILRNSGSTTISYTLAAASAPSAWTTIITPTQVGPLAPGAETTILVSVTVPAGTALGTSTVTTVRVRQLGGPPTDLATAADTTIVGPQFSALLTPLVNRKSGLPGATMIYTHTLTNRGANEDTFILTTIAPNGWDTRVAPTSVNLPRGGSTLITVTVQIPTTALSTTLQIPPDIATLRAQSATDSAAFGTAQEHTTVLQVAGLSLSPQRFRTATPGRTISFQHTLINTGNGRDTFDLTATISGTGVLTWPLTLTPLSTTLDSGSTYPVVIVRVQVPANAALEASGRIIIMATSQRNPLARDQVIDVLAGPGRVVTPSQTKLYLPIILR